MSVVLFFFVVSVVLIFTVVISVCVWRVTFFVAAIFIVVKL